MFERTGDTSRRPGCCRHWGRYGAWQLRCRRRGVAAVHRPQPQGFGHRFGAGTAHRTLGDIYRLQGDFARALESNTRSLALWDKTADVANRAATMFAIGQVFAAQRAFGRAIECRGRSTSIGRKASTRESPADARRACGGAPGHRPTGHGAGGVQESLGLREKTRDMTAAMWTLVHMGVLHGLEGRYPEALSVLQRALDLAPSAQAPDAVAIATALRARSLLASGGIDGSLAVAAQAADLAAAIDHLDVVAHARVTTGRAQRQASQSEYCACLVRGGARDPDENLRRPGSRDLLQRPAQSVPRDGGPAPEREQGSRGLRLERTYAPARPRRHARPWRPRRHQGPLACRARRRAPDGEGRPDSRRAAAA